VVEKVAAELLAEEAKERELLRDRQFGNRTGRSAIDAVAITVDRAHAAWMKGHITGVLLMDSKVAFPSVAKGTLVNLIKVRQIDGDHIQWTERCLCERMVEVIIEGNTMERHPVEAGVPKAHLGHLSSLQSTPQN